LFRRAARPLLSAAPHIYELRLLGDTAFGAIAAVTIFVVLLQQ